MEVLEKGMERRLDVRIEFPHTTAFANALSFSLNFIRLDCSSTRQL